MAIVTTHVAAVQELYVAYFGRPADVAGLDYWTNVVAANQGNTTAISAAFATSSEYTAAFAGMNNTQIVDKIYLNLFGRAADAAGRDYWVGLLNAGTIKVDTIVAEVSKGSVTTDKDIIENKVAGATAFTNALDLPAEQAGYSGTAALTLAKAFITGITTDATLDAAIAPAALAATVSAVVVAGTPFSLNASLAALQAAGDAKAAFLVTADGDNDAKTSTTDAAIEAAVGTAATAVDANVAGDFANATAGVRAALLADQVAVNAAAVTTAQAKVVAANTGIAAVAGLTAAVATHTSAKTAASNADKAVTAAAAKLAGDVASFNVSNTTATKTTVATVDGATGAVSIVVTTGGVAAPAKPIIVVDAETKKLVLAAGVTEANTPGVTAILASTTAKESADATLVKANQVLAAATEAVNYLDMSAAEITNLQAIALEMPEGTVAAGALPTLAQITTYTATLQKAVDDAADGSPEEAAAQEAYDDFADLVATYKASATVDTRVKALTDATAEVTAANKAITDLTKLVDTYNKAVALDAQKTALNDAIKAAEKVFLDNKLAAPVIADGSELATGASDIYVAGKTDAEISLFGLIGTDSLYIGTNYTLNTGALTTGNNAVLEAFIIADGANTNIVLEKTVFGSSAATPEVVTITLVGVDATDVQLNNGIITLV